MNDLIFKLCSTCGVSGCEDNITKLCYDELSKYSCVKIDNMGNLIATFENKNAKKHILFDAHIDQIGLIVTSILEDGFLKVSSCGGVDCRVMQGSTVVIHGSKDIIALVASVPPHLLKKSDTLPCIEDLLIDTGMKTDELKNIVSLGDRISLLAEPVSLLNNKIASPALDNRAGVASLLRLAQLIKDEKLDVSVSILLSVQEEVGEIGAKTAPFDIYPDEAIVVDVSFANQPGVDINKSGKLNKGPMIGISPVLSRDISNQLVSLSKKNNIEYQLEIMGESTGTNADAISITKSGIKTGLVSIPQRNMHTAVEIVSTNDIENTAKLLFEYIKNGGLNIE